VTKSDLLRFDQLHRLGCICCRKAGSGYRAPDVHHILEGGRRLSHQVTLPLCPEHHRFPSTGAVVGPSLADGSKVFAAKWGTQMELLAEVNTLIASLEKAA
jgi:hypothetical protein